MEIAWIIAIIAAVILLIVIWAIVTSNGFKKKELRIRESLSGVEVALTKRYDMLTKLLDTAKGYAAHEKEIFETVITLRRGMSIGEMNAAEREMETLTSRLFAVAESYPTLRSSEVFAELQRGIRDAEEHLQAARRLYNANVKQYNTAITLFPSSLLAGGRTPYDFFEAEAHKRADVEIKL